jgi:hypothetical protein
MILFKNPWYEEISWPIIKILVKYIAKKISIFSHKKEIVIVLFWNL